MLWDRVDGFSLTLSINCSLEKDLECYLKEKESEKNKIDEMKQQNADIYDIRQLVCNSENKYSRNPKQSRNGKEIKDR